MKTITLVLLATFSHFCLADYECDYSTKNLTFKTPESADIENTFWQDDQEGYETVKRLYLTYKDGSIAVLEHKFCSVYNFEVLYYFSDRNLFSKTEEIQKKMNYFFSYASLIDTEQQEAIDSLIEHFNKNNFNPDKTMTRGYSGFAPELGDSSYFLGYYPLGEISVHEAALRMYMGIGGVH